MERGRKVVRRWRARSLPFACASVKQGEVMAAQVTNEASAPILDFSSKISASALCGVGGVLPTPFIIHQNVARGPLFDSNHRRPSTYCIKAFYSVRLPAVA
jgi:hypothetical protein